MNDTHPSTLPPSGDGPLSADDWLPPVQPPAASFILQLFLIPLLIVSIIVAVWLMFSWLARSNNNPQELVADIERLNHASWQKALTLANHLRDPRQTELRQDEELAQRLATLLSEQLEEGRGDKDHVWLRMYLCRALGEFEIDTGLPALALAAVTEDQVEDAEVRRAALQAIGILAGRLDETRLAAHPDVLEAVIQGTEEYAEDGTEKTRRELLRSTATYVLGLLPGDTALDRLAELLHDPSLDVGYNAATSLARHGDPRSLPMLEEMLDPPEDALLDLNPDLTDAQQGGQRDWKHHHIVLNALRSIGKLNAEYPSLDLKPLPAAVERLAADESQDDSLRIQASEVHRSLRPSESQ